MPPEQKVVSTPSYQLPPKPVSPGRKKAIITIVSIVVAVLVVIGLLVAALFYFSPVNTLVSALLLPSDLKDATFVVDSQKDSTLYHLNGFQYNATPLGDAVISADGNDAKVVHTATTSEVIIAGKTVFATSSPVMGIATNSTTGASAFAVAKKPQQQFLAPTGNLRLLTVDPHVWYIDYHKQLATGALDIQGPQGVEPVFLNDHTIAYISPAGIGSWDTQTGKVKVLLAKSFNFVPMLALVSPDHTLIGIHDRTTKTVTIYRISPSSAEVAGTITLKKPITTLALGNDGVYLLHQSNLGTTIEKQAFGQTKAEWHGFLPKTISITRLLIGSL